MLSMKAGSTNYLLLKKGIILASTRGENPTYRMFSSFQTGLLLARDLKAGHPSSREPIS